MPVLKQSLRGEKRAYKGCSLAVKTHSSARRTERIDPPRADYAIVDGSSAGACPEQRQNSGARFDNSASAYDGRINASATGRASSAEVELARALVSSCAAPSGGAYIYGGWSARHGVLGDLWEYVGGRGKG